MKQLTIFDGASIKSKELSNWTADEWQTVFGSYFGGDNASPTALYSAVGWLYRCVELRADRVASMPWSLFKGETELITDVDDLSPYPFLDNFSELLELTESALSRLGYAYWFKTRNVRNAPLGLRWFAPDTVEPLYNAQVGISGFRRWAGGFANTAATNTVYSPDDIVYFRLPNAMSELEPGVPPARAAMADAQVLNNMADFAGAFFARGAIKATVLKIDKNLPDPEMAKLEAWWKRFFSGVKKAWSAAAVRADNLEAVVVGEGMESLTNSELTTEARQSIATAMGVPHSIVAADAANFATAQQDEINFLTNCIIPEARLIERTLNRQLFASTGLRLRFQPERLSAMQEDEEQRAQAYSLYVNAHMLPSVAAQVVGLNLPADVTFEQLDAPLMAEQQLQQAQAQATIARLNAPPQQPAQLTGPTQDDQQKSAEIRKLLRWAKGKKTPDVDLFHSHILDRAEKLIALGMGDADGEDAPFPYP